MCFLHKLEGRRRLTSSVTNLESHMLRPFIETLRRVRNPTIFTTNCELIRVRRSNQTSQEQKQHWKMSLQSHGYFLLSVPMELYKSRRLCKCKCINTQKSDHEHTRKERGEKWEREAFTRNIEMQKGGTRIWTSN